MKKMCTFLMSLLFVTTCLFTNTVYAEGKEGIVKVTIEGAGEKGEVKEGQDIVIKVDLNEMDRLYTAMVDFYYDKDLLRLQEPVVNEELLGNSRYELPSYVTSTKVRYGFSYLRDSEGYGAVGFTGSSPFITIKGKVLKDGKINTSKKEVVVSLVRRVQEQDVQSMNYKLDTPDTQETINSGDITINPAEPIPDKGDDDRVIVVDRTKPEEQKKIIEEQNKKNDKTNNTDKVDNEGNSSDKADNKDTNNSKDDKTEGNSGSDKEKTEDKNNTTLYVVLGVVAAVVLVGGGIVFYKNKKNSVNKGE